MPRYDAIQPLAFRLHTADQPLQMTVPTLAFPAAWKTVLHELQSQESGRDAAWSRLKIRSLNKALRALVPDLISIAPDADKQEVHTWLIGRQRVDQRAIHRIVSAWVHTEYAGVDPTVRRHALEALHPTDLVWRAQTFDIGSWGVADNHTAIPHDRVSFVLLPDLLAAQLSHADSIFHLDVERLQFRRAPLAPGSQGAELISWPPLRFQDKRGVIWAYSVLITLTVQTIPFQAVPVIYCDLGLRRWVSQPITYLPGGTETSVYLMTQVPWLEGIASSTSFQVAPIRWTSGSHLTSPGRYEWGSRLAPMLNMLLSQHRSFPNPETIRSDPWAALNIDGTTHAALAYRNGIQPEHRVLPGLMPVKRRELTEQLVHHLQSLVYLHEPLPQRYPSRHFRRGVVTNPFVQKTVTEAAPAPTAVNPLHDHRFTVDASVHQARRTAVARAVGTELCVEIYYQTAAVRDALIYAIQGLLGIDTDAHLPVTITTPELRIVLHATDLSELGAPLELSGTGKSFRERLHTAVRARIAMIATHVTPAPAPVAAFVELQGEDNFVSGTDPKHAIRAGFAQMNRLTQFLTVGADPHLSHRATNGVLDMFRQLGVVPELPKMAIDFPEQLGLVGLWLIKRTRGGSPTHTQQALPVLVHLNTHTHQVKAYAPGLSTWLPYPSALLALSQAAVQGTLREFQRPRDAMRFLRPTIEREFTTMGDTLLLVHAQNARSAWPWLQNGRITIDSLTFGDELPQPLHRWPGLRIARLRDNQSHETPEWYAQHDDQTGFTQGVFTMGDRVFASTHPKPPQFKKARRGGELEALAWNPAIIEVTAAALQSSDDPLNWTAYIHELRRSHLHADAATVLPLPLHLAEAIGEYVVTLDAPPEEEMGR